MSTPHIWIKHGYLWTKIDNERLTYGDIIFNTMSKIVEDGDTSEWALYSWFECAMLLRSKKRWPDEFKKDHEAPNRWVYYIYRTWRKYILKQWKGEQKWSRPQKDITRDPHYTFGDCYVHLHGNYGELMDRFLTDTYHSIKLPWYVWRYSFYQWKKRLKGTDSKHFVKRLRSIRARATHTWFEKNYEDDFYINAPKTN